MIPQTTYVKTQTKKDFSGVLAFGLGNGKKQKKKLGKLKDCPQKNWGWGNHEADLFSKFQDLQFMKSG